MWKGKMTTKNKITKQNRRNTARWQQRRVRPLAHFPDYVRATGKRFHVVALCGEKMKHIGWNLLLMDWYSTLKRQCLKCKRKRS
jgi:hypothetical protein